MVNPNGSYRTSQNLNEKFLNIVLAFYRDETLSIRIYLAE